MTTVRDVAEIRKNVQQVAEQAHALAVEREREGLPLGSLVDDLVATGIGAVRVPVRFGGADGTVADLAGLLVLVATAESNLAQVIRGHLGFVEFLLQREDDPVAESLLARAGAGEFFGPAASSPAAGTRPAREQTAHDPAHPVGQTLLDGVHLHDDGRGLRLSGVKYYSTGSLYADWINVLVPVEDSLAEVVIARDAPGVSVVDDWSGFGQRFTASGTVRFDAVEVPAGHVLPHDDPDLGDYLGAFYQFVHSATQAGIVDRAATDIAELVRGRGRSYPTAPTPEPRHDPQVLAVVGEIASRAFAARAAVDAVARSIDGYLSVRGPERRPALDRAILDSSAAQVHNSRLAGEAGWLIFDAASASALDVGKALDRHWRNARTVSSHNPSIYKARIIGDHAVNQASPRLQPTTPSGVAT